MDRVRNGDGGQVERRKRGEEQRRQEIKFEQEMEGD